MGTRSKFKEFFYVIVQDANGNVISTYDCQDLPEAEDYAARSVGKVDGGYIVAMIYSRISVCRSAARKDVDWIREPNYPALEKPVTTDSTKV